MKSSAIQTTIVVAVLAAIQLAANAELTLRYSPAKGVGPEAGVMRRDPSDIIRVGDLYYVWYSKGKVADGYDATVWYATSPDGHAWTEKGEALARGPAGSWDAQSVFTPNILAAAGRYWLFYTAVQKPAIHTGTNITKTAIGIAVADSPNGQWKKLEVNPVLKPSDDPREFDSARVDDACLLVRGGKCWLYYKGRQWNNTGDNTKMGVAIAERPDGPYVKSARNPVVGGGHEVLVWPLGAGVAAMVSIGPKDIARTIQYASDGLSFSKLQDLKTVPFAPGAYRPEAFTGSGNGKMPEWGIHIGAKNGYLPFLERFDCEWGQAHPPSRAQEGAAHPPNIIFILSDDLAQGDVGCYGQKLIQTPRLDRMAREGTRFTQAYCGTSVCAPSRSSLMTGLHSGHCPVRGNWEIKPEGQLPLPAETVTVAQVLKSAGYATACMGKWGMGMFQTTGSPLKKSFDHFFGYDCQRHAHSYFPTYLYRDDQRFDLPGNDGKGVGKTYAQNLIQADVLDWVGAHKDQPFFLFYAITLPHGRQEIDDLGRYAEKPWTAEQKAYAAQVTRLDRDVGQLLDLLKQLGLESKTLVMLAGDNGSSWAPNSELGKLFDQAGNGLRGFKRGLYEGALRQAAIARWPGVVPAGRVSDEPWAFWDFLATAAELASAKVPAGCRTDGLSLVAFLKGGPAPRREFFYWELHETQKPLQAVRFGDWKAVKNGPQAALELYDLAADPGEKMNLAAQKPDLVAKAAALMKAAHAEDPNWPLSGMAKRRKADQQGAFGEAPPKAAR